LAQLFDIQICNLLEGAPQCRPRASRNARAIIESTDCQASRLVAVTSADRELWMASSGHRKYSLAIHRALVEPIIGDIDACHSQVLRAGTPINALMASHMTALVDHLADPRFDGIVVCFGPRGRGCFLVPVSSAPAL